LLAGEGGVRQVLGCDAGPDGLGGLFAEPNESMGDRRHQVVEDGGSLDRPADCSAERPDSLPVVEVQAGQAIKLVLDWGVSLMVRWKTAVLTQKPAGQGCRQSVKAVRGVRPCRQRGRFVFCRSLGDAAHSGRVGVRSVRAWCSVSCGSFCLRAILWAIGVGGFPVRVL